MHLKCFLTNNKKTFNNYQLNLELFFFELDFLKLLFLFLEYFLELLFAILEFPFAIFVEELSLFFP